MSGVRKGARIAPLIGQFLRYPTRQPLTRPECMAEVGEEDLRPGRP